ncbi:MAG TPA: TIR domain-containing protein [Chloroflexota bacterium]|nr:TIR domain-containing protein [Chloroflexota bacterium]
MDKQLESEKKTSIFISYSRKDKAFVQKLHNNLVNANLQTWVDWEGIPLTADWWQEIKQGIENADAFAFVISPDSLKSKVCADEIQTAVDNNKRLIPVMHRDPEKGDPIHPKVSSHNWIYMRDEAELEAHMPDMVKVIHTDLDWVKAHTRLLRRAVEWEGNGRNTSFLLRGDDLKRAEDWQNRAGGKEPAPTELQTRYIADSRKDATRRSRILFAGVTVSLIIALLAIFSYLQSVEANQQRGLAEQARATAVVNEHEAVLQREIAVFARATAEAAAQVAEEQRGLADEQREIAEEQRDIAVVAEAEAARQKEIAEEQRDIAVAAEAEAARQRDIATLLKEQALALKTAITGELLAQQNKFVLSTLVALQSYQQQQTDEGEQLLRSLLARLPGAEYTVRHDDWVNELAFSPDGRRLLSASDDGTAVLWDVATGESLFSLPHEGLVFTATFSPDGRLIATGDAQNLEDDTYAGTVTIWDAETGEMIRQFPHQEWINDVEFSPDGRYLAYGVYDGIVRVVNAATGTMVLGTNQSAPVWDVTFSPDGSILVSSDDNGRAWVWDVNNPKVLVTLSHEGPIYGATFSPNSERLATFSEDGTARIWNRFNWLRMATVFHENWIVDAAFSPDSRILATASADGAARLWQPETGKQLFEMKHQAFVNDVTFSPNGKWVVTSSDDNTAILWDVSTGQEVSNMIQEAPVFTAAFSPDGSLLATGDLNGVIAMWDITKDTAEVSRAAHTEQVNDLALTQDGSQLVTASADGLYLWDMATLQAGDLAEAQATTFIPTEQSLTTLALAPDNQTIAAAGQTRGVWLWDRLTGTLQSSLANDQTVSALAFSPDGRLLATSGGEVGLNGNLVITVWDTTTGQAVIDPIRPASRVSDIIFTPDGNHFVTAEDHGRVQFYNSSTGEAENLFPHNEAVYTLAFSADGRYLATGTDNAARVWNVNTGRLEADLFHNRPVRSLAFSPNSNFLLTGSEDGNLRIWELGTWHELGRIHQGDSVNALVIHPNGRFILTNNNILAVLWDFNNVHLLRPHQLTTEACSRLSRNLTRSEWEQYIGTDEDSQAYRAICPNLPLEE